MIDYPFVFNKIPAVFLRRENRFVVVAKVKGKIRDCYLPNSGRLWELLIPNETELLLFKNKEKSKLPFTVLACKKGNHWVMLHTHLTNKLIRVLINEGKVSLYKDFRVIDEEIQYKGSRFDLLLSNGNENLYLEVKTCTLFGKRVAMFPDAVTSRGRRHLLELKYIAEKDIKTSVLFVVMNPEVKFFLPCYHIDFDFAKTLMEVRDSVNIKAIGLFWDNNLTSVLKIKELEIPFSFIEKALKDRGVYILIIHLYKSELIEVGNLGQIYFQSGFYVYVGSAMNGLKKRIKRHKSKLKRNYWHIDYLLRRAKIIKDIAIVTEKNLECEISNNIKSLSDTFILKFGCSDCSCESHLFYFKNNPLFNRSLIELVEYFWIDSLEF